MNLQENTSDLYLLSLPYNFTYLLQTEGRAWRQGNKWENVRINFMLTNDSINVFMLQKLQAKQSRHLEAMKKGANLVEISDINTQELKTSIITNPETRADIEIELMKVSRVRNPTTQPYNWLMKMAQIPITGRVYYLTDYKILKLPKLKSIQLSKN
ncbi:TPA: hypothetical protein NEG48_003810 [Elizabethkingia anophelis]|nr:hypothetical protein [Elizabethkingia anophelis]